MCRQEVSLRKESQRFQPEEVSGSSCARPAAILVPQPSYTAVRSEVFRRTEAQELSIAPCLPEHLPSRHKPLPPPPRPTRSSPYSRSPARVRVVTTCVSLQPMCAGSPLPLCWLLSSIRLFLHIAAQANQHLNYAINTKKGSRISEQRQRNTSPNYAQGDLGCTCAASKRTNANTRL